MTDIVEDVVLDKWIATIKDKNNGVLPHVYGYNPLKCYGCEGAEDCVAVTAIDWNNENLAKYTGSDSKCNSVLTQ